jgi:hypothetical protein
MSDPFLLAHHVAPRVFNMSGKLTPVSIKDQMIRGRLFAERAAENGEISAAPDQSLLVIGGGVCGITAAIRAVQQGIPATVLERSPRLFGMQAACATRWLDPFQYDWPLDHWYLGAFPTSVPTSMPLPFAANWASALASLWRWNLGLAFAAPRAALSIQVNSHLTPGAPISYTPPHSFVQVHYTTPAGPQSGNFGAVLVTTGFGTENTASPPAFRGFPFWQADPLAQPNCGLPLTTPAQVLISGGGDGALQDFLRITTQQHSAKDVFQVCAIPSGIAAALKDVERCTAAAYHWAAHPGHDHGLHMELQQEHGRQVTLALGNPTVSANLGMLLTGRPKSIKLVHVCEHLTPYYSLNRFLTLLIARYIEQVDGVTVIESQTSVTGVQSANRSHGCASNPTLCHGAPHAVDFHDWFSCRDKGPGLHRSTDQYNVVVLRHGILAGPAAYSALTPIAQARQVLPFYLS